MSEQTETKEIIEVPSHMVEPAGNRGQIEVLPAFSLKDMSERYRIFKTFVEDHLVKGIDYGTIPGTAKPTLLKPGAEKLTTLFGLTAILRDEKVIENFDKPLFYYRRICELWRDEWLIAQVSGSCNSMENRYRWRWMRMHDIPPGTEIENLMTKASTDGAWLWAINQKKTDGQYGKPLSYWAKFEKAMQNNSATIQSKKQHWDGNYSDYVTIEDIVYRVPNEDIYTLANTILKMADKRAFIAAVLLGTNASEFFTQDVEDMDGIFDTNAEDDQIIEAEATETNGKTTSAPARQNKAASKPAAEDTAVTPDHGYTYDEMAVREDGFVNQVIDMIADKEGSSFSFPRNGRNVLAKHLDAIFEGDVEKRHAVCELLVGNPSTKSMKPAAAVTLLQLLNVTNFGSVPNETIAAEIKGLADYLKPKEK